MNFVPSYLEAYELIILTIALIGGYGNVPNHTRILLKYREKIPVFICCQLECLELVTFSLVTFCMNSYPVSV